MDKVQALTGETFYPDVQGLPEGLGADTVGLTVLRADRSGAAPRYTDSVEESPELPGVYTLTGGINFGITGEFVLHWDDGDAFVPVTAEEAVLVRASSRANVEKSYIVSDPESALLVIS